MLRTCLLSTLTKLYGEYLLLKAAFWVKQTHLEALRISCLPAQGLRIQVENVLLVMVILNVAEEAYYRSLELSIQKAL